MLERLIAYVLVIGAIVWVSSELATPDEASAPATPDAPLDADAGETDRRPPAKPPERKGIGLLGLL